MEIERVLNIETWKRLNLDLYEKIINYIFKYCCMCEEGHFNQ